MAHNHVQSDIMYAATRSPVPVNQLREDKNKYLSGFEEDMVQLKNADVNTWLGLASNFLLVMNNANRLVSECFFAKEWYSAREDYLKEEIRKREGVLYDLLSLDTVAATARHNQLKIACSKDETIHNLQLNIVNNKQVIAEYASLEILFKGLVSQADNAHVTSRMAGKRDLDMMYKESAS